MFFVSQDVIALRKRSGTISGDVLLNGWPQEPISFRRCSGYVEQFDVQTPQLTVFETILFSARLRLDPAVVTTDQRMVAFVKEVMEDVELDDLLASLDDDEAAALDENIPEVQENPVSRTGDIWIMGEHRLLCGDSTSEADMKKLMDGELADMVFTDPPYNVNCGDTAKDKLRSKGGAKAGRKIMNDNLGDDFEVFLTAACKNMLAYTPRALFTSA